jgi:hypothetical protein
VHVPRIDFGVLADYPGELVDGFLFGEERFVLQPLRTLERRIGRYQIGAADVRIAPRRFLGLEVVDWLRLFERGCRRFDGGLRIDDLLVDSSACGRLRLPADHRRPRNDDDEGDHDHRDFQWSSHRHTSLCGAYSLSEPGSLVEICRGLRYQVSGEVP